MDKMTTEGMLIAGLISIISAVVTAFVTAHFTYKAEEKKLTRIIDSELQKVYRDFTIEYAKARHEFPKLAKELAKQQGIGFLYAEAQAGKIKSKVFIPPAGRLSIGRAHDNDLVISDPRVSRQHAVVRVENGVPYIENLEATNGTILNGSLIEKATALTDGDELIVGRQIVKYVEFK